LTPDAGVGVDDVAADVGGSALEDADAGDVAADGVPAVAGVAIEDADNARYRHC
jgi:hypothetical protein